MQGLARKLGQIHVSRRARPWWKPRGRRGLWAWLVAVVIGLSGAWGPATAQLAAGGRAVAPLVEGMARQQNLLAEALRQQGASALIPLFLSPPAALPPAWAEEENPLLAELARHFQTWQSSFATSGALATPRHASSSPGQRLAQSVGDGRFRSHLHLGTQALADHSAPTPPPLPPPQSTDEALWEASADSIQQAISAVEKKWGWFLPRDELQQMAYDQLAAAWLHEYHTVERHKAAPRSLARFVHDRLKDYVRDSYKKWVRRDALSRQYVREETHADLETCVARGHDINRVMAMLPVEEQVTYLLVVTEYNQRQIAEILHVMGIEEHILSNATISRRIAHIENTFKARTECDVQ